MTNWIPLNSDIDECAEPGHGCSQLCNNTKGSYSCFCLKDFFLKKDNKTCVGKLHQVITYLCLRLATHGTPPCLLLVKF